MRFDFVDFIMGVLMVCLVIAMVLGILCFWQEWSAIQQCKETRPAIECIRYRDMKLKLEGEI